MRGKGGSFKREFRCISNEINRGSSGGRATAQRHERRSGIKRRERETFFWFPFSSRNSLYERRRRRRGRGRSLGYQELDGSPFWAGSGRRREKRGIINASKLKKRNFSGPFLPAPPSRSCRLLGWFQVGSRS